jgi:hypothetical protein
MIKDRGRHNPRFFSFWRNAMRQYQVTLHDVANDDFIITIQCWADDWFDAEARALKAYPNGRIIKTERV